MAYPPVTYSVHTERTLSHQRPLGRPYLKRARDVGTAWRRIRGESHLSIEVWARLMSGRIEHEELLAEIVPHLVASCGICREIHAELERLKAEVGHWDEVVALTEGREAETLWREVAGRPFEEVAGDLGHREHLHTWGLCQLLIAKSRRAVFEDPPTAVDLAALARKIAGHLGEVYDPAWVADLRARAAAALGNARRVLGETRAASQAFVEAHEQLARGTGDPLVEAGVLDLEASLRRGKRRFPEALALVERALAAYRLAERPDLEARSLVNKAKIAAESGALETAIAVLDEAAPLAERHADVYLSFVMKHNLLYYLSELGRFDEAQALLPEVRTLSLEVGSEVDRIRLRWFEGRLALGRRELGPAEAAFREAQEGFLDRRLGYDAALVVLDLAMLYAREGATEELKRLAAEVVPVFESREVQRESFAALSCSSTPARRRRRRSSSCTTSPQCSSVSAGRNDRTSDGAAGLGTSSYWWPDGRQGGVRATATRKEPVLW